MQLASRSLHLHSSQLFSRFEVRASAPELFPVFTNPRLPIRTDRLNLRDAVDDRDACVPESSANLHQNQLCCLLFPFLPYSQFETMPLASPLAHVCTPKPCFGIEVCASRILTLSKEWSIFRPMHTGSVDLTSKMLLESRVVIPPLMLRRNPVIIELLYQYFLHTHDATNCGGCRVFSSNRCGLIGQNCPSL